MNYLTGVSLEIELGSAEFILRNEGLRNWNTGIEEFSSIPKYRA
jgi:hypothetical protein